MGGSGVVASKKDRVIVWIVGDRSGLLVGLGWCLWKEAIPDVEMTGCNGLGSLGEALLDERFSVGEPGFDGEGMMSYLRV
jgi:hypothetical protein